MSERAHPKPAPARPSTASADETQGALRAVSFHPRSVVRVKTSSERTAGRQFSHAEGTDDPLHARDGNSDEFQPPRLRRLKKFSLAREASGFTVNGCVMDRNLDTGGTTPFRPRASSGGRNSTCISPNIDRHSKHVPRSEASSCAIDSPTRGARIARFYPWIADGGRIGDPAVWKIF